MTSFSGSWFSTRKNFFREGDLIRAANASMRASCSPLATLAQVEPYAIFQFSSSTRGWRGVAGHGDLGLGRERLVTLVVRVEDRGGAAAELLPVLQRGVARRVGETTGGGTPQHAAGRDELARRSHTRPSRASTAGGGGMSSSSIGRRGVGGRRPAAGRWPSCDGRSAGPVLALGGPEAGHGARRDCSAKE